MPTISDASTWSISRRNSSAVTPIIAPNGSVAIGSGRKEGGAGDGVFNFYFDPDVGARLAPALWRPEAAGAVVALTRPPFGLAGVSFAQPPIATVIDHRSGGERHLIFDAGGHRIRLWLCEADSADSLAILLPMTSNEIALASVDTARRWLIDVPIGSAAAPLYPSDFQRHRFETMLRALDASLAGASLRAIGTGILFPRLAGIGAAAWKASSERRQAQRLLAEAHAMAQHGYRDLLGAAPSSARGDNSTG